MQVIKDFQRENYYNLMVKAGEDKLFSDTEAPRLVILVRDDILPPIHQGIQAMHSVISLSGLLPLDSRCYLILLGANDDQIGKAIEKAYGIGKKKYALYADPGLVEPKSERPPVTACAFEPMTGEEVRKYFGGLRRAK